MTRKALYKHRTTGDLFAIEVDKAGSILSTSGPLLTKNLDPDTLDYDNYWDTEVSGKLKDFVPLSKHEYMELLRKNGFHSQSTQRHLFW